MSTLDHPTGRARRSRRTAARIAAASVAAATAGVLAVPGAASAHPRPDARAAARSGVERFTITGSDNTLSRSISMSGPIKAVGTDYPGSDSQQNDLVVLAGGAFTIFHPDADATFSEKLNPKTCVDKVTGSGSYTLGNGYGLYANLTGSGTFSLKGTYQAGRNPDGSCNEDQEVAGQQTITGSGPLSY